jgi:hypothetical protein
MNFLKYVFKIFKYFIRTYTHTHTHMYIAIAQGHVLEFSFVDTVEFVQRFKPW